jgi:TonB-linked SusC/RagA family outer membrane protein
MKLTCLLAIFGCTGLQLLMASPGKSQELNDVRVSLELKNEPLRQAFTQIERQTDFRFAYSRQIVDQYKNVSLARGNYTVEKAMELLLGNTRLLFRRLNNKIIVYPTDDPAGGPAVGEAGAQDAQSGGTVSGTITNEKNEPLVGASILLARMDRGSSAGLHGEYSFAGLKPGKYQLQASAIGYQTITREITISEGQSLEVDFQLRPVNNPLSEVVVTGYTRQSKRDVTGAASTISADVVAQTPATDVTGILQGRVAGVTVDGQGGPGAPQVIRIRGIGTLGNNDPLYVIDGVQIRVGVNTGNGSQNISNLLNPSDIESITILKDPSLISLYGAEGSNGVVVITTKTGKLGAPRLDYNSYVGQERPRHLPKTITPQQQADAYFASFANSSPAMTVPGSFKLFGNGSTPVLPDYIIEQTGQQNIGVMAGDPAANPGLYNLNNYRILKANKSGTDWWGELFRPAVTQNHQLSLSGATDKSNYAVTLGYLNDQGTLLHSYFTRYSLRVNTQFKVQPWLRLGENLEMSFASQNSMSRGFNNDIASLYLISPLLPTHDIAGKFAGTKDANFLGNQVGSPLTDRSNSRNAHSYSQSIIGTAYAEAEPIKGLVYTNQIGFQFLPTEFRYFSDTVPQDPGGATVNAFSEGGGYTTDWRWLNKLAYTASFAGIHRVSAFVAYEAREYAVRLYSGLTGGLPYTDPSSQYLGQGNPNVYTSQVSGGGDKQTDASLFGNLTYSLMDKYLFTASGRRDGSSKFGPYRIYGDFGAVSGGWRISKERFMENIQWISDLKLRASYGSAGNNAIPSGLYQSSYSVNSFGYYDLAGTNTASMVGAYLYQFGNPNLHWETNVTTNIGFDAALFQNRVTVNFNWFEKTTKGLLYQPPAPGTAGSALAPYLNIMNFTNKGIELELGYNGNIGKLRYEMGFNLATYRNRVNYIDGLDSAYIPGGYYGSGGGTALSRSVVGRPIAQFYGYVSDGLFQNKQDVTNHADESIFGITPANGAGHFKYRDLNHDGKIDLNDQTYIGNPNPKFTYGYNLNLYYGNFDFGVLLQGVYGNQIFNYFRTVSQFPNGAVSGQGGLIQGALDTWTPSHTNAKLPVYSQNTGVNDLSPSSYFVESGSYMRVKMLQLGYTFPKSRAFSRLRVYVQAYNLFTVTHYSGIDPEVSDGDAHNIGIDYGTAFPISMKLLFGVNLGL